MALDALRGADGDAPFLPLSRHRPARAGSDPPPPRDWLAEEWAQGYPRLPGLPELFRRGPFLLLLDALNEIAYAGPEDYRGRIGLWRELLADLAPTSPPAPSRAGRNRSWPGAPGGPPRWRRASRTPSPA